MRLQEGRGSNRYSVQQKTITRKSEREKKNKNKIYLRGKQMQDYGGRLHGRQGYEGDINDWRVFPTTRRGSRKETGNVRKSHAKWQDTQKEPWEKCTHVKTTTMKTLSDNKDKNFDRPLTPTCGRRVEGGRGDRTTAGRRGGGHPHRILVPTPQASPTRTIQQQYTNNYKTITHTTPNNLF